MNYAIFDTATGKITCTGSCPDSTPMLPFLKAGKSLTIIPPGETRPEMDKHEIATVKGKKVVRELSEAKRASRRLELFPPTVEAPAAPSVAQLLKALEKRGITFKPEDFT